jgi:hypothetical protein
VEQLCAVFGERRSRRGNPFLTVTADGKSDRIAPFLAAARNGALDYEMDWRDGWADGCEETRWASRWNCRL